MKQDVTKIVEEYQPRLKAFIRKRVSNEEDAADILQDVFYQLARVNCRLNPIDKVAAWLFRVTRNTIINLGTKKRESAMPVVFDDSDEEQVCIDFSEILFNDESSPSPETVYLRSLVWKELESALSELPALQREVFEKTELEGMSLKELSQETNTSVNTLISRKHYAVLHLREKLAELYQAIINY